MRLSQGLRARSDHGGDHRRIGEEGVGRHIGQHAAFLQGDDAMRVAARPGPYRARPGRCRARRQLSPPMTRTSMIACLSPVETPLVGSSSRMTEGLSAKALAISSSFFSPCDSVEATVSSLARKPKHFRDTLDIGLQHVIAPQRAKRIARRGAGGTRPQPPAFRAPSAPGKMLTS